MPETKRMLIITLITLLAGLAVIFLMQRRLIYLPSHDKASNGLDPWLVDGNPIGYSRSVKHPENVWLLLHGNAGQAADRTYAIPKFSPDDAIFIMEYPGYGQRSGSPGKESFNKAAREAYLALRKIYPSTPVCVAAESIGSGPACSLATLTAPPDKIVLIVPFARFTEVASTHYRLLPAKLLLLDRWDNIEALKGYRGRLEIFAAPQDEIIPFSQAEKLAASVPGTPLHRIPGGHNDWPEALQVRIRNGDK